MRLWVIAIVLAVSSTAHAELRMEFVPDRREAMEDYFDGEIMGGWTLTGMGVGGLVAGGFLYADGGDRARGASYVSLGFGVAHLAAGIYINVASRVRKRVYGAAIASAPEIWLELERHRMAGVSKQFLVLKIVEVALIAGGGTMAAVGNTKDHPRLEGAGYALAIEAAATLVFDIVASRRARRYRDVLGDSSFGLSMATDAAGQPVMLVGPTLSF